MNAPFTYASPTLSVEALKHSIAYKLMFTIGKDPVIANKHEWLNATLFAVRDRLVERWLRSNRAQLSQETRQVYYLSMEFLIGRTLSNALLSLGIYDDVKGALEAMGLDLEELIDEENDPGLGNGGLGRLAACFLDSLATLGLPGRGYGIRYDYGMFKQNIVEGGRKSPRTIGWNTAIRGSSSAIIRATKCVSAGEFSRKARKPAGLKPKRFWRWPMTRLSRAMIPTPPTRCACGALRPVAKSTLVNLTRATISRR
ncbi:glycogen phosphorylase [Citrobacter koseri]|nr:glycogen phosphorylase [Citrobacter koseri]